MKTPIDMMLDGVTWVAAPERPPDAQEGLYATHSGVLHLAGHDLRCHRLNNGQAVFDADDFTSFFEAFTK